MVVEPLLARLTASGKLSSSAARQDRLSAGWPAAIAALGEIEDLWLLEQERLEPDENYLLKVKVSLDIEALPLPLRPVAYLKPSWDLSSGWSRWPLER